jgi:signal transduction histidine kinase
MKDLDAQLLATFSKTSAIGLAMLDNQYRFRFVNNAVVAMHIGIPAEAFVGSTIRDILGDAVPEPQARFQRAFLGVETPFVEVSVMLPSRTELGYWVEKNFPIKGHSGRVTQIASLAVEVTAQRKLENRFRELGGNQLQRDEGYRRLAQDLHDSIEEYHTALGTTLHRLSRCTRDPERIPEILAESMDFLNMPMQKLVCAIDRCFPHHKT